MRSANTEFCLDDPLLTNKEAAREIRVSHHTINSWFSKKKLPRTKVGGKTFVRKSALEKMIRDDAA